ncbi:hypothetical protein AMTR_s00100p00158140 [Amborella trichopoda]|uniref:Uncharacterized protein n=1 Tax=Amborella trichopoda TaxID=13333 RepID=W1NYK1_AMBTC|nr:hypothetical protein AMTR_s00100p00158140 [Amborella trichopoda]
MSMSLGLYRRRKLESIGLLSRRESLKKVILQRRKKLGAKGLLRVIERPSWRLVEPGRGHQ